MNRMEPPILLISAFFLIIGLVPSSADAINSQICPEGCHCTQDEYYTTLHCTSFGFIKKLNPKEIQAVKSLDIVNSSLTSLEKHYLKKLVNLERLNLSYNRLTDITYLPYFSNLTHLNLRSNLIKKLPIKQLLNLEVLDISHNYIREIPQELVNSNKLKRIYLGGNIFKCSRESLDTRDALFDKKIKLIGTPICSTPIKFHGKSWKHAIDFDDEFIPNQEDMLADEAEGSGELHSSGSGEIISSTISPYDEDKDSDFEFGSGEPNENINIDTTEQEEHTTEYLNIIPDVDEDEGSGEIDPNVFKPKEVVEPIITTRKTIELEANPIPTTELDDKSIILTTSSPQGNMKDELQNQEAVTESDEGSTGTIIFLGFVICAVVGLLIYFVKRKKSNKQRNARRKAEDLENQNTGIELLPKPSKVNVMKNGNAETDQLMNGQNGDVEKENETVVADTLNYSPVEMKKLNGGSRASLESANNNPPSQSPMQDVLSIKVRASEIPDSIPKTPILIDKRRTSDGQSVVVTPNLNQRAAND